MHPVLIKLGPVTVYSYGVMVALGFAIATFFAYAHAPRYSISRDKIVDLAIVILISGIIGARALYVGLNLSYYLANPYEILKLFKGGLVWYGAFLAALIASAIYLRRQGLKFWNVADLLAPYIALAQAFGRIGCFLNGCCYGKETGPFHGFGVAFPGESVMRYPTQIYSAVSLVLIFVILRIWQDKRRFDGEIFLGYCALYACKRFVMEFLRGDNPGLVFGLTVSQAISIFVLFVSLASFLYKKKKWQKKPLS